MSSPVQKPIARPVAPADRDDARISSALGLFNALPDAVLVCSDDGSLIDLNPAAEKLFGCSLEQTGGKPLAALARARGFQGIVEHAHAALERQGHWRGEIKVHTDGVCRVLDATALRAQPGSSALRGTPASTIIVGRDITALAEQRMRAGTDKSGFCILLIDDSRDAAESMGSLLSLLNYEVRTAFTAQSGLELAIGFEPQLILCDIGLPDMDGYRLASALRQAAGSRRMILAAASGYGMACDRSRSLAAGFDHHLVKPIDADTLLNFVALQAASF